MTLNPFSIGTIARATLGLTIFVAFSSTQYAAQAPAAVPKLIIEILDGEGAVNNIRLRTAREPIVLVEDENHRPVSGALVSFKTPAKGPSGTFGGSHTLTLQTNAEGKVTAKGFKSNDVVGAFAIAVAASYGGKRATGIIHQTNVLGEEKDSTSTRVTPNGKPADGVATSRPGSAPSAQGPGLDSASRKKTPILIGVGLAAAAGLAVGIDKAVDSGNPNTCLQCGNSNNKCPAGYCCVNGRCTPSSGGCQPVCP